MAEKKVTIKEQFVMVKEVLAQAGREDLVAFVDGRIAVLDKKAENRKPTKTQAENEILKARVVEILEDAEKGMTATEILNADVETFKNVQKVTALLKALVDNGKIVKEVDKKKAFFTIA